MRRVAEERLNEPRTALMRDSSDTFQDEEMLVAPTESSNTLRAVNEA